LLLPGLPGIQYDKQQQVHYLMPLFPALALMVSRSLPAVKPNLGDFIPYGIIFGWFVTAPVAV
jgi:hypothetical protein